MGKSTPSAPAPDPQIGEAALKQAKTGEEWLAFTKDAFEVSTERQAALDDLTREFGDRQISLAEDQQAYAKEVSNEQRALAQEQAGYAREDRQRYKDVFQPVEDQFVKEAAGYDTPERRAAKAAEAKSDVQSSAAQQRAAAQRESASFGINPASGRFQGVNRAADLRTALASAGAQNSARKEVENTGLALKGDVANLGRGLPTQSSQAAALGLSAGNSSVASTGAAAGLGINALGSNISAAQNNQNLSNSATGIANAGFSGAMSGYAGQANTLQNQYNTQVGIWQTQTQLAAQNAAGFGRAIGGLFGLGAAFLSDEEAKEDKKDIQEGAALEAVEEAPATTWNYKPGAGDGGEERHVGPMAQDMAKATGLGDGRSIKVQDMLGLHHAAIGELNRKVDAEFGELDQKVDKIAAAVGIGGAGKAKGPAAKKKANLVVPEQKKTTAPGLAAAA